MRLEVVYSPLDALEFAAVNQDVQVMFLSVGFETTAPTEAVAVRRARERNILNFSILCGNKLTPPAVKALLDAGETRIDGFILPGHVSAIIGVEPWRFVAESYHKPCVVAGFESYDLITSTINLVRMIGEQRNVVENGYARVVRDGGNPKAREIMYDVFEECDAHWRGIGVIPGSGLALRDGYADFDAARRFPVDPPAPRQHPGCRCGDLLRGLIIPTGCGLFGTACTPENAVGPCMVSSEGPCSAYYKYGGM
jgi:hydrogenase expression/formation protein HypD